MDFTQRSAVMHFAKFWICVGHVLSASRNVLLSDFFEGRKKFLSSENLRDDLRRCFRKLVSKSRFPTEPHLQMAIFVIIQSVNRALARGRFNGRDRERITMKFVCANGILDRSMGLFTSSVMVLKLRESRNVCLWNALPCDKHEHRSSEKFSCILFGEVTAETNIVLPTSVCISKIIVPRCNYVTNSNVSGPLLSIPEC